MNSKEEKQEKLMLYTPLVGGMPIAGTELRREGSDKSDIVVGYPGHVSMNQRQTGYVFTAPQFTDKIVTLHKGAMIMSCILPPPIQADYIRWRDNQKEE